MLTGDILTGLIFMNYGFAYFSLTLFGSMFTDYYGSSFTILLSIIISSLALLFMTIFSDYFVWLMMLFVQGIAFALFNVGYNNFIIDNISIKSRKNFESLIVPFYLLSMICGCIHAGNAIGNHSINVAIGITMAISLTGIIFLCTLSIPPKYNDNCLVKNDSQQQIDIRGNNEDRIITKASIYAWRQSYKQISFKQRFSPFSWIKNQSKTKDVDDELKSGDHTPTYGMDDELNTLQVFRININTLLSISIFSFGLTFVRCARLLIITFKCMNVEELTPNDIGHINGISFLPELFVYFVAKYVLYHYGRRWTMVPSFLLFIIGLFSLPYCNDKTSLTWIALLFGLANGWSYGLIHKVAIDVAPTEHRDKFMSIYQGFTNFAWIVAPIFVALLTEGSSIETASICSAVILIISLFWSWCIMTDPKQTGKRYEQLDFEKSYGGNDELSIHNNGLINGKHIGRPIRDVGRYKMQLHSIDSVMERDSVAGNDTAANNDKDAGKEMPVVRETKNMLGLDESESESDEENTNDYEDDYAQRIANKQIGLNVQLGADLNVNVENKYHRKFEIGHFDEEEEEESMMYNLSSTDGSDED